MRKEIEIQAANNNYLTDSLTKKTPVFVCLCLLVCVSVFVSVCLCVGMLVLVYTLMQSVLHCGETDIQLDDNDDDHKKDKTNKCSKGW